MFSFNLPNTGRKHGLERLSALQGRAAEVLLSDCQARASSLGCDVRGLVSGKGTGCWKRWKDSRTQAAGCPTFGVEGEYSPHFPLKEDE